MKLCGLVLAVFSLVPATHAVDLNEVLRDPNEFDGRAFRLLASRRRVETRLCFTSLRKAPRQHNHPERF